MVAGANLAHHRIGNGGHAGGKGATGFGAFNQRHALLEHVDSGIGEARIIVAAGNLVLEQQFGMFRARIGIAGIEEEGFAGLVEGRTLATAMDHLGRGAEQFRIVEGVVRLGHLHAFKQKTGTQGRPVPNGL
ncbi:hypothetical protein D9M68_837060 [compost metagenome]